MSLYWPNLRSPTTNVLFLKGRPPGIFYIFDPFKVSNYNSQLPPKVFKMLLIEWTKIVPTNPAIGINEYYPLPIIAY